MLLDSEKVAEKLAEFAKKKDTVLFAGAGIGCRVGLPSWPSLLATIAEKLNDDDHTEEANLIKKRLKKGSFLTAASVVRSCDDLVESERYSVFSEPFTDDKVPAEKLELLETIVTYPSAGIVTTNYDRTLLRCCSKFRGDPPPISIEVGDGSLRGAATRSDFILARIHGRVEIPSTLKISSEDYALLDSDKDYLDFLSRLFEFRSVLFVGFSFSDPAIDKILNLYRDAFSPNFPVKHAALIPSSGAESLLKNLNSVNIEPWIYDDSDEHHHLWNGFRINFEERNRVTPELGLPEVNQTLEHLPQSELHRFLAFTYAQSQQASQKGRSMSDLVRDSLIVSLLGEESGSLAQKVTLVEKVRSRLKLNVQEATEVTELGIESLTASRRICQTDTGQIQLIGKQTDDAAPLLNKLARTVAARARTVYDLEVSEDQEALFPTVLEKILLARAWDIGTYFSGASLKPNDGSIRTVCGRLLKNQFPAASDTWLNNTASSFRDLFANPTKDDGMSLAKLGRAAVAVQLALGSPRSTIFQTDVLPDVLYFDASIILPAIVKGHPLQAGYLDAVKRLMAANNRNGQQTPRKIGTYFIDEILAHRAKSIEIVSELGLEKSEKLEQYVQFSGVQNVNVYISGFSSWKIKHPNLTYSKYLEKNAPYTSKAAFINFLFNGYGIETVEEQLHNTHNSEFNKVFSDLSAEYANSSRYDKASILIRHEAEQLVALSLDLKKGRRPLFVTADATLRKMVSKGERISGLSGSIVSSVGFIGLVDLLVGLEPDPEIYTRLLWGIQRRTDEEQLFDYLIARCVSKVDQSMMTQMPDLVHQVVSQMAPQLAAFEKSSDLGTHKKEIDFIDRAETDLMAKYSQRIQEIRRRFGPSSI